MIIKNNVWKNYYISKYVKTNINVKKKKKDKRVFDFGGDNRQVFPILFDYYLILQHCHLTCRILAAMHVCTLERFSYLNVT